MSLTHSFALFPVRGTLENSADPDQRLIRFYTNCIRQIGKFSIYYNKIGN